MAAEEAARAWRSQPAAADDCADAAGELSAADMDALLSHSQPAHADDLLLATQHDSPYTQVPVDPMYLLYILSLLPSC